MRVVHFSYDDKIGGAGRHAYSIHNALCEAGVDSRMLVMMKSCQDESIQIARADNIISKIRYHIARYGEAAYRRRAIKRSFFTSNIFGLPASNWLPLAKTADIIQLNFVAGMLTSRQIAKLSRATGLPIVWSLADCAPFTGGCHFPATCEGYRSRCGNCPEIGSSREHDRSRRSWRQKRFAYDRCQIHAVAPSAWLRNLAHESTLMGGMPTSVIGTPVDPNVFRPINQAIARDALNLPHETKLILVVAADFTDGRKGLRPLMTALRQVEASLDSGKNHHQRAPVALLSVGSYSLAAEMQGQMAIYDLGRVSDDRLLALAYAASDLFVCPSLQDTNPLTTIEAAMSGKPVVAFDCGIAPEIIKDGESGFIAQLGDGKSLGDKITTLLESENLPEMGHAAHASALAKHAPSVIAKQYIALYENLLGSTCAPAENSIPSTKAQ
jgi:glycosyltransferase involved in cell wall biosynthesis